MGIWIRAVSGLKYVETYYTKQGLVIIKEKDWEICYKPNLCKNEIQHTNKISI